MLDINIVKLKKYAARCSVLYVEDDELIRTQTTNFLGRFFKDIIVAEDGALGLEIYKSREFDIVITDINMPNMNGIEMIEAIKEIYYDQIVLVTSAYNDSEYLMKLINLDVMRFILKPFNNKQFLYTIYKIAEELSIQREKESLEDEILQISARSQKIVDAVHIGIIVIKNNVLEMANRAFLKIGGFDSFDTLKLEMPDIGVLFDASVHCVNASTNEEFIRQLKTLKEEDKKVRLLQDGVTKEYQVALDTVEDEIDSYIITFDDITAIHNSLNTDETTGLPNRKFVLEKIETIKNISESFSVILVGLSHYEGIVKYYGKAEAKDVEKSFTQSIVTIKNIHLPKAFIGYLGFNKFVVLCREKELQKFMMMLQEIHISSDSLRQAAESSHMKLDIIPIVKHKIIESKNKIQDIEEFIDNEFEMM